MKVSGESQLHPQHEIETRAHLRRVQRHLRFQPLAIHDDNHAATPSIPIASPAEIYWCHPPDRGETIQQQVGEQVGSRPLVVDPGWVG